MRQTVDSLKPGTEWIRPGDVRGTFGIGRAQIYKLIAAGKLRSVCIRQPHKAFGMRLVNAQSIRDYIEKQSAVPSFGKARSRDYYSDNGRKGAQAKAEKTLKKTPAGDQPAGVIE
jgi:hypothetical protein